MLYLTFALASTATALSLGTSSPASAACADLTSSLGSSKVISSSLNPDYIISQKVYWNTRLGSQTPSCVVYPSNASDVSTSLKTIKRYGSRFAVKAGGHNPNKDFSAVNEGGVLIHLKNMNTVTYDKATNLATYGPGGPFGDIYKKLEPFGVAVTGARLAGVGTGLGLGGGLSYLSNQYGLSVDGFRELEVVLPSGEIVTANSGSYPDLFFAMRGGGGNAYGIVTKYTVEARPTGTFHSGNIIYPLGPLAARANQAAHDFARYNTDPKAAIIGTWEKLGVPDLGTGLQDVYLLFAVYDGPDPGHVFDNFTAIPHLIDDRAQHTYVETVNNPPFAASIARSDNIFRTAAYHIDDDSYLAVPARWQRWAEDHVGMWSLLSIDLQPIPKSLTDASKRQGGNAINLPDGPYYWLNYLISTPPTLSQAQYDAVQESFKQLVESTPSAKDLPLFLNDAHVDQNPLLTFSTYPRLKAIKQKYDPDGFFTKSTGGWAFP